MYTIPKNIKNKTEKEYTLFSGTKKKQDLPGT